MHARLWKWIVAVAMCQVTLGCGQRSLPEPTDPHAARATLLTVLSAWQAGKSPADLRKAKPPIHVADEDWLAGWQLVEYQITDEPRRVGLSVRCSATLKVRDVRGQESLKSVTYTVTTNPALSVVRED